MPVWLNCRGHSRPMCAPQIGNGFTSSVSENAPLFGNRLSGRGFVTSSHVGRGGISLFQSLAHQIPSPTACLDLGPWSCYGDRVWIHLTFCFHLFITVSTDTSLKSYHISTTVVLESGLSGSAPTPSESTQTSHANHPLKNRVATTRRICRLQPTLLPICVFFTLMSFLQGRGCLLLLISEREQGRAGADQMLVIKLRRSYNKRSKRYSPHQATSPLSPFSS